MHFILFIIQILFLVGLIYFWIMVKTKPNQYTVKQKKALILLSILGIIMLFPAFIDFSQGFIEGFTSNL